MTEFDKIRDAHPTRYIPQDGPDIWANFYGDQGHREDQQHPETRANGGIITGPLPVTLSQGCSYTIPTSALHNSGTDWLAQLNEATE